MRTDALGEPRVALGAGQHRRRQRAVDRRRGARPAARSSPSCLGARPDVVARRTPADRSRCPPGSGRSSGRLESPRSAMPELARHQVADFLGDRAIAGDLAADHRDDARHAVAPAVVVQRVLARDLAFVDVFDAHQRANAGPGVVAPRRSGPRETRAGPRRPDTRRPRRSRRRRPDRRDSRCRWCRPASSPATGSTKNSRPSRWANSTCACSRRRGRHEVDALGQPQQRSTARAQVRRWSVEPRPGGVDRESRARLDLAAAERVAHDGAGDARPTRRGESARPRRGSGSAPPSLAASSAFSTTSRSTSDTWAS